MNRPRREIIVPAKYRNPEEPENQPKKTTKKTT